VSVPETLPYGAWKSPITSDLIVAESIGLGGVIVDGNDIYWSESRPSEGGRNVLVKQGGGDVTPAPFNVRSRVHEYGGGSVTVHRGTVYFSNFADQRLYRLDPGGAPQPLTPEPAAGTRWRYADGAIDAGRQRWIGVREAHEPGGAVDNTIVAVDPTTPSAGRVLVEGADFYAAPRVSPDGTQIAWLSWSHPNMPWVGTELWVGAFAADGSIATRRKIAGGDHESIAQPQWAPDGILYLVSDRNGWWNLHRCDAAGDGIVRPVCPHAAEFCPAQWVFGQSSYAFLSANQIVCCYGEGGRTVLARLDTVTGKLSPLALPYCEFGSIKVASGRIVCGAGSPTGPGAIVTIDPESGAIDTLRESSKSSADPHLQRYFTVAQHLEFPTGAGGRTAAARRQMPWRANLIGLVGP
jgi:dipeptidyl aminopeptidase/acylaminoacyl peptidase